MATSGKIGLTLTPRSPGLNLPPDKSSLNEKLRSLMRGSEIALMRISSSNHIVNNNISLNKQATSSTSPPSCPLRTSTTSCHPSPSIGVTSNNEDSNTITISITSSGSGPVHPSSTSSLGPKDGLSSSSKKSTSKPRSKGVPSSSLSTITEQPRPKKRKKETPKAEPLVPHHFVYTRSNSSASPFVTHFEEEVLSDGTDDSIDEDEDIFDPCPSVPFPSTSFRDMCNDDEIDMTDLRSRTLTQKLLLKRWIRVKMGSIEKPVEEIEHEVKEERRRVERKRSYLDECLEESRRRFSGVESQLKTTPMSIRKGVCCFAGDDEARCLRPSIPFARHCLEHILYNVDQMIFERCTAKDPLSLTQCSYPAFDIERDEPLCDVHVKSSRDRSGEASQETSAKSTPRRRAKGSSNRRKKRKTVGGKGSKEMKTQIDDSGFESNQLAQPDASADSVASNDTVIDDIPLRSLTNGIDSAALDVGINLAPVDEALVASLVHELPFEPEQSEFNLMPDDSFTDIFSEPLKGNPEVVVDPHPAQFVPKNCLPNGDNTTYHTNNYNSPGHLNGQQPVRTMSGNPQMMPHTEDISSLPANILDFLTTEQQQQLNGLIDGDLSLTSSPTVKCNPAMTDYVPNGHIYHHQATGCPLNGLLRSVSLPGDIPLTIQSNHQDQMFPPPPAAFAQYGVRSSQSSNRSVVGSSPSSRFSGTVPSSSIKHTVLNDSMARNQFVKITSEVGHNPHHQQNLLANVVTASNAQVMSNQFTKIHHRQPVPSQRNPLFQNHTNNSSQPAGVNSITVCPPIFDDKSSGS